MIMTLQDIKDLKKQLGLTNAHLAALSGVPLSTVQKVLGNTTSAPRQATLRRLEDALIRELGNSKRPVSERTESGTCYPGETALECCTGSPGYSRPDQGIFAGETASPYHIDQASKGIHTIKDYYSLPKEQRSELIDGTFYDMAAPDGIHQDILLILGSLFRDHIRNNKGNCKVYVAPRDVQLDPGDDKTIVQPDILVVCDRSKITSRCIMGAPDFIVEILSPSTREVDLHIKALKYAESGVLEYWIIDPEKKIILVYRFPQSRFPTCFSFADTVPVGIWNDQMQVDFKEISSELEGLYQ
jgi:Uma2 family endonuclease